MIAEKKTVLRPILESSEGIHLTMYLVNRGDLTDLKAQLQESLTEASDYLHSVQTVDEQKKFLEPLNALFYDARILKRIKGNIGIFRTKSSFRILNVPVELERQSHVATSFHVKPLLRWMQLDREFLLLGLTNDSAHLYLINQTSLQKIDSILFPETSFSWLNEWLEQATKNSNPKLFLAGEKFLIDGLLRNLKYKNTIATPAADSFGAHNLSDICEGLRGILKNEAKKTIEQALMEFRFAEETNLAKKNIFQIAKAAVQGKIKKLIVADNINIFGTVDKKTGGLAIHPFDLNHEDDDILDDLAQTVLASGGEVVIASREEIPKGRPILAILEDRGTEIEKNESFKERTSL